MPDTKQTVRNGLEDLITDRPVESKRYLSFSVGDGQYALDISKVTEIVGLQGITPLPNVPEWVRGIINLRGRIIPVVDVRLKFGWEAIPYHDRTCIVITQTGDWQVGLIVEQVSEVVAMTEDQIITPPDVLGGEGDRFISGIGKMGDATKMIVELKWLLGISKSSESEPADLP